MARGAIRFLLPHERWLVGWMLASQRKRRTSTVVALERKYGPEGMIWMDAFYANALFGVIPFAAVLIPVLADPTRYSPVALYLFTAGFLFLVLGLIRLLQASHSGRKFRGKGQE